MQHDNRIHQGGGLSSEGPSDGSVSTEETGNDRPAAPIPVEDYVSQLRKCSACEGAFFDRCADYIEHLNRVILLQEGELELALRQYAEANEERKQLKAELKAWDVSMPEMYRRLNADLDRYGTLIVRIDDCLEPHAHAGISRDPDDVQVRSDQGEEFWRAMIELRHLRQSEAQDREPTNS